jgi:hypothetical protein
MTKASSSVEDLAKASQAEKRPKAAAAAAGVPVRNSAAVPPSVVKPFSFDRK